MFIIHCRTCDSQHVVSNQHIQSIHRSAEGMMAYVRCAAGHTVLHQMAERYPKPPKPEFASTTGHTWAPRQEPQPEPAPARRLFSRNVA